MLVRFESRFKVKLVRPSHKAIILLQENTFF